MSLRSAIPAMAFLLLGACAARQPAPAPNDEAGLRTADSLYVVGVRNMDIPGLVAHYAPDAIALPPDAAPLTNHDAIREFLTGFAALPQLKMNDESQTVSVSGDLGYTVNLIHATFVDPQGKPVSERMRDVHVWRRDASGQWKIVMDIWNSPPADSGSAQ